MLYRRALLLKCITDFIRGSLSYFKSSGLEAGFASKYRLFFRNDEMTLFDKLSEQNINGQERLPSGHAQTQGFIIGNDQLQNTRGRALLGAVARLFLDETGGPHSNTANGVTKAFFWADFDDYFELYLHDMVRAGSVKPREDPHLHVIQNYPKHYFNTGEFKRDNKLSSYMKPFVDELWRHMGQWRDGSELSADVLSVLDGSSKTGSGSGAKQRPSLVDLLQKKWEAKEPVVGLSGTGGEAPAPTTQRSQAIKPTGMPYNREIQEETELFRLHDGAGPFSEF